MFDANGKIARAFVEDMTRLLLLVLFLACSYLVWVAWRRKARSSR